MGQGNKQGYSYVKDIFMMIIAVVLIVMSFGAGFGEIFDQLTSLPKTLQAGVATDFQFDRVTTKTVTTRSRYSSSTKKVYYAYYRSVQGKYEYYEEVSVSQKIKLDSGLESAVSLYLYKDPDSGKYYVNRENLEPDKALNQMRIEKLSKTVMPSIVSLLGVLILILSLRNMLRRSKVNKQLQQVMPVQEDYPTP